MTEKKEIKLLRNVIESTNKAKDSLNRVLNDGSRKLHTSVDTTKAGIQHSLDKVNDTTEIIADKIAEGTKDVVDMIKDADIKEAALLLSGLLLL